MFNSDKQRQAGASIFLSSMNGLANTLAVIVTFFGAPALYGSTVQGVISFTVNQYGYGFEDLTSFAWFVVCLFLVFFISRASISTALMVGAVAIATRFLV